MRSTSPGQALGRMVRLVRKELSSVLRDRRTIITLVLMPVMVYPLLSIAFRQFLLASGGEKKQQLVYRIGFRTPRDRDWFMPQFLRGKEVLRSEQPELDNLVEPELKVEGAGDIEQALLGRQIELGVHVRDVSGSVRQRRARTFVCDLLYREGSTLGREAKDYVERRLAAANNPHLGNPFLEPEARPASLRVKRAVAVLAGPAITVVDRPVILETREKPVHEESKEGTVSLAVLIPLILILMTMTGAVYPAIDLTAGERERGTLEVLIAAPIPRLGLLFAKYVSVVTVAVLTAVVNLVSMTATLRLSGLGAQVFGEAGLSLLVILKVFGLLLLFAAFFSAVLLTVTSFARSFKEAQAYLIPLMLVSMTPGMLSLLPRLKLQGTLLVAPLLNIVLLTRDVLQDQASAGTTVVVVLSTLVYAVAAIAVAARIFGAEAVLYSEQASWGDMFRRSEDGRDTPAPSSALFCLAILFPISFLLSALLDRLGRSHMDAELVLRAASYVLLFGAIPLLFAWMTRVRLPSGFRFERLARWAWGPAILLGLFLWPLADSFREIDPGRAADLRSQPAAAFVLARGVVPAVLEELFFRGFLLAALLQMARPRVAIFASAIFFGLFHLVHQQLLIVERAVTSTLLGLVLGWLAWRSGSVVPGMIVHSLHNSCLLLLFYFQKPLTEAGWLPHGDQRVSVGWTLLATTSIIVAVAWMMMAGKGKPVDSQS